MGKLRSREGHGGRRTAIAVLSVALGMLLWSSGVLQASVPSLDVLLKRCAVAGGGEVPFEERKFIGAVTEPLVSRGYLRFEPPNRLIKKTETPNQETAIVDQDRVSVRNADGAETANIGLWADPDLRLIFDSLRAALRGDGDALRALFETSLSGAANAWTLTLTPKEESAATRIERIVVTGDENRFLGFDIYETGGDRSLIRLLRAPSRS
jgi:outer membrane lipoprotein-sorting protein